jgi:hypothetical protein
MTGTLGLEFSIVLVFFLRLSVGTGVLLPFFVLLLSHTLGYSLHDTHVYHYTNSHSTR